MRNTVLLTALSISIIAGTGLSASSGDDDSRHGPRPTFQELDSNGDGSLTGGEMQAHFNARFDEADANGDGQIDKDELRTRMQERANKNFDKRVDKMFKRRDANGDGQLSRDEMQPKRMAGMMERADTDGDGAVSQAEFEAMKDKHRKWHKQKHKGEDTKED